ncbi:MAG: tRNA (adenosine(37)-N6)-threonylcarbamoyltransferase complex dimerization subunit type 1 TsaB [Ruminococcaceae bacterium]|nr:tRNA (adenosine(37)-N6)-threonylcarbamoyltransferase complex dimerization subunit type 1 TsaB [Oscillospiraceae bacterium]
MKILALDCSAKSASAVICEDEKIIAQNFVNSAKKHSETLMPMVEDLFSLASLSIADVDMFACNAGPGSFTGVRIGVSQIKGLAFGRGKPCVPVSTLESLAYNLKGFKGLICPVMDARRNQFYNALFLSDGHKIVRLTEDRLISVEELERELRERDEDTYFSGDAYYLAKSLISLDSIKETPPVLINQNAWSVAYLAQKKMNEAPAEYTDTELSPIYLRASQAERERNERIKAHE